MDDDDLDDDADDLDFEDDAEDEDDAEEFDIVRDGIKAAFEKGRRDEREAIRREMDAFKARHGDPN